MIRKLNVNSRYFLAPMHNINDIAFRKLCKKAGAEICWTELINPESKKSMNFSDKPAIQLVCNQTRGIKKFMQDYSKQAVLFDLNLGCPSLHAKQNRVGWFMHKDYDLIEKILMEMRNNTQKPITIKIRKMSLPVIKKIIEIAERYCDAIIIHPRNCKQGYSGEPDIDYVREVKILTKLPIIYSGNITNKKQADFLLKEFDYVMIGRAAIGNPSIFSELTNKRIKNLCFEDYLILARKYKLDFNQIKRQAIVFTKGQKDSRKKRGKLVFAKTISEIKEILRR